METVEYLPVYTPLLGFLNVEIQEGQGFAIWNSEDVFYCRNYRMNQAV